MWNIKIYTLAITRISYSEHLSLFFYVYIHHIFILRLKELTFFSIENMAFYFLKKYAAYQAVSFRRPWVIDENCCMYKYEFCMTGTPKEAATRRTLSEFPLLLKFSCVWQKEASYCR